LLRTVGRLGHISKRFHAPGLALSIVVHDSDLGISRGHNRIPVVVTTIPGGDVEEIFLTSAGAGKGLFRADLDTALGDVTEGDGILQLMGDDVVKCDYPEEFKQDFKNVPLSDVEIKVAANADFAVQSSVIETEEEATFSQELEQENDDQRVSQIRPATQVKPGNPLYIRIEDADRDMTAGQDEVVVKLATDSGDEVQVVVTETEPHSGIFEGQVPTAELPAGATASDTAIDHSPLMAIDQSKDTVWVSRPDGQTPKVLTVDMKDLYPVSRVRVASPSEEDQTPVRMDIQGSYDGEYWFRVATHPAQAPLKGVADEYVGINRRVYEGDYRSYRDWNQVLNLVSTGTPVADQPGFEEFGDLDWNKEAIEEDDKVVDPAHAVVWHGLLTAERAGAVRIRVEGETTALLVDGVMELALNVGARNVDVWLEKGQHEITVFAACSKGSTGVRVKRAYASVNTQQVSLQPFTEEEWATEREQVVIEETPLTGRQEVDLSTARFIKTTAEFGFKETETVKVVGNWTSLEDQIAVSLGAVRPGLYELWLEYAHPGTSGRFSVQLGRQEIEHPVIDSGGWGVYVPDRAGVILVEDGGSRDLLIKPLEIQGGGLMELRNIFLMPAKQGIVDLNNEWEFRFPSYDLRYTRIIVNEYIGNSVAINHVVVGDASAKETQIPTDADILSLAQNNILEIAAGDIVRATYTDERTQNQGGTGRLLTSELQATYYNASIAPIAYDQQRSGAGGVTFTPKALMRIDPGERITIQVTDYDRDQSDELDEILVEVSVNNDAPIVLTATETDAYSGIFTKEVDTAGEEMDDRLVVKQGDRIYIRYLDEQNTFPGHSVKRESVVYVNEPTDAQIRIVSSRMIPRPEGQAGLPTPVYLPADGGDVSAVAFEVPLLVEVIDPDMAKDDRSQVTVAVQASNGSTLLVDCVVSSQFSDLPASTERDEALYQGRFIGQIIMQLGSKDSPALVPLTIGMPRGLVGRTRLPDEEEDGDLGGLVARVLNLSGEDQVLLAYKDEKRATGEPSLLRANAKLVSNGQLHVTDREYEDAVEQLHVGEKLYLRVYDADKDISDERDEVVVEITTELGEKEVVKLFETTIHSGEFTGSYQLVAAEKPTPSNSEDTEPKIESYFGDVISVSYIDDTAATESGELSVLHEIPVVVGTNGLVSAFTKVFNDEELAVETKFRIAESYFELFKSHKELGRDEDLGRDLEAGRRILKEVMEDYPDPKYVPRIAYLRGQFAQELEQWSEAIRSYELLLTQYPDHTLAADAQYKLAQTYEDAGDFDEALEAYVTLAATYPKSPLIASVMIRIADHFYKQENFKVAAQVGEKFLEKFSSHEYASRMAFRVGQCYYKSELYTEAGTSFDRFAKLFPEDPLGSDSMFWAGESYRMGNNNQLAFRRYNRCRWDFPSSEAAKYARGRLALPEMIQQFETEANSIDNDN
ncbi:MAG: tetratricopeptide repeat protein, partial [Pirellulales bacterium]|nr:tetratricopeptide repeat protein [Pirellulales bacterium]